MQGFCSLKKSTDFKTIHEKGLEIKTKFLVVKYCNKIVLPKNKFKDTPILGITISRKIGKAIRRNLIKRRIKAIFTQHCNKHNIQDMIFSFYTKKAIIYSSFKELKKDVDKILKSI